MNEKSITGINIVLNQWSLSIQIAILSVFVIIFFALKSSSNRRVINSWFWAWSFNAMALSMVIFVLKGSEYFSPLSLRVFYSLYAIAKIWFVASLFTGLYQLLKERNLFTLNTYKQLTVVSLLFVTCLNIFSLDLLTIQILVYTIVGSIFFVGSLIQFKIFWHNQSKIILLAFFSEGLLFLHHGLILLPVAWGEALPGYMTHISFFDAILELIVGISCLFAIANKVNNEMTDRNLVLAKSQSALRKLVNVDPLTGLWHRRYFESFLKQYNSGATIVHLKIDQLSAINDEWGHSVGDLCIKEMAGVMQELFNAEDGLFRIKGNSFLIITPGIDEDLITRRVQQLKNKVAANPLCAPIISLSTSITSYQQKSKLQDALSNASPNIS